MSPLKHMRINEVPERRPHEGTISTLPLAPETHLHPSPLQCQNRHVQPQCWSGNCGAAYGDSATTVFVRRSLCLDVNGTVAPGLVSAADELALPCVIDGRDPGSGTTPGSMASGFVGVADELALPSHAAIDGPCLNGGSGGWSRCD